MNYDHDKTRPADDQVERTRTREVRKPDVDIRETEKGIVLMADMPGIAPEGLGVTLDKTLLTLEGNMAATAPEGRDLVYSEFGARDFMRTFTLSDEIDRERISATLKNGVLKLVLPKVAAAQPRRIAVQAA